MKTTKLAVLVVAIAVAMALMLPNLSWAAEDGAALYKTKCAGCHGADGAGKPAVKAPAVKGADEAKIKGIIKASPKHAGAKSLTDDQVKAVAEFIKTLK